MVVEILSYSGNHIDARIMEVGVAIWKFIGFYGHPEVSRWKLSWELLVLLHSHSDLPWLCMGDFNEIVEIWEKWGRVPRAEWQMKDFCQAITQCNLRDLGFHGPKFTWCNNRSGEECIKERLDRSLWLRNGILYILLHGWRILFVVHLIIYLSWWIWIVLQWGWEDRGNPFDLRLCGFNLRNVNRLLRLDGVMRGWGPLCSVLVRKLNPLECSYWHGISLILGMFIGN